MRAATGFSLDDEEVRLVSKYEKLGPNARKILLALADRLVIGIAHGDFDKPHDWDKESSEEALDLAVYQAAKLLGLGNKKSSAFSYVSPDGRTTDGKPWVPPVGAKVRVVAFLSDYGTYGGSVGEVRTVLDRQSTNCDWTNLYLSDFREMSVAVRVVPA